MTNKLEQDQLNKVSGGTGQYNEYYAAASTIFNTYAGFSGEFIGNSDNSNVCNKLYAALDYLKAGNYKSAIDPLRKAAGSMSSLKYQFPDKATQLDNCASSISDLITKLNNL